MNCNRSAVLDQPALAALSKVFTRLDITVLSLNPAIDRGRQLWTGRFFLLLLLLLIFSLPASFRVENSTMNRSSGEGRQAAGPATQASRDSSHFDFTGQNPAIRLHSPSWQLNTALKPVRFLKRSSKQVILDLNKLFAQICLEFKVQM
ncbi:hypothetical protein C8J56DRAFT_894902 [Mycena floridula]|nr:hypothetical protein C8J56DRAFT_894902 [Mycena floridula]